MRRFRRGAQSYNGVYGRCAPRGDPTGSERDASEQPRDRHERIGGAHAEKQVSTKRVSPNDAPQADDESYRARQHALAYDQLEQIARFGALRQTNPSSRRRSMTALVAA